MAVSLPYTPKLTPKDIITTLDLSPHPEGGYYRQTFIDDDQINGRAASTMIYFLIEKGNFSHIHRIDAAEAWHFYAGQAFNVVELKQDGAKVTRLGLDLARGERPQYVVKRDTWFGSLPAEGSEWALVGCTVAPGFLFEKFEMGDRQKLIEEYPKCKEWIDRLTKR